MRAVVTRVKSASVEIDGKINGSIGKGFLVLLGVHQTDTQAEAAKIADFPIARPVKSATLSFDGINPAWAATFAAIKDAALDADFPGAASIDEAQWNSVVAKLEDYKALKQSKLTEGADVLDKEGQDKKAAIDPNQCVGCTVCAQVCPMKAIEKA